ncbi:MAG TPA: GNAT family N-acetyltransferase [Pirellulales bacterium]|jgi:predicted acetyltransferase
MSRAASSPVDIERGQASQRPKRGGKLSAREGRSAELHQRQSGNLGRAAELGRATARAKAAVKQSPKSAAKLTLVPGKSARLPQKSRAKTAHSPPPATKQRLADTLPALAADDVFSEVPPAGEIRLTIGRSGDHASVYHMLLAVFQNPSREEFHAQSEDPFYEPSDRLLVKRSYRVLSHVHLIRRNMRFGAVTLPMAGFQWLGTLPEFRGQGLATRIMAEAEQRIAAEGSLLGVLRTRVPKFFHRFGWAVCGRHSYSQARARDVLGQLHTGHAARLAKPLSIRLWRHVEMPALERIYRQNIAAAYGALERTEAYWRWLIGRRGYDSLLVALDGPDKLELEETIAPIVGYAVLRQERVIELFSAPGHPSANYQLLARACGDAIEHNRQEIKVSAPPGHPVHQIVCDGDGVYHNQETDQADVFMVKIVDPLKLLAKLAPELEARAKQAGLPRDTELGLCVDGAKWRVVYNRRGIRIRTGKLGRNYLTLNRAEFTRLALGHGLVRETAFAGRIQSSTQTAIALAESLFPRLPLWRPEWDDSPAG